MAGCVTEFGSTRKASRYAVGETELRMNVVAGDEANAFGRDVSVCACDVMSFGLDPRVAPFGVAGKKAHQVEQMHAENEHILTTSPAVLFAVGMNFRQLADQAAVEGGFEMENPRRETHLMRDRNFALQLIGQRE